MNGYMRIYVQVLAAQARKALASVRGEIDATAAASKKAGAVSGIGGAASMAALTRYGTKLQQVGRQLFRNFSVPLIAAGAFGVKFALDQQKAMVKVAKVYGDAADTQAYYAKKGMSAQGAQMAQSKQFRNELEALGNSFTFLSEKYAVQKKDVEEVAGAWAAAGASGVSLAKDVDATLRTSVIGDMDLVKSGQALIAIQSQYNLSSQQLADTLDNLNAVENATGIDMEGLIQGFQRSAGVASTYGVSARYLAADLAALVPASGSAANAGNALKTILSRLMAPTTAATKAFKAMGLNVDGHDWASSSAQDRLLAFAASYNKLSDNARGAVGAIVFGRYQVSRSEILMADATRQQGYYAKALNATSTQEKAHAISMGELNAVLDSQPKKLARVGIVLQNSLANIMVPLIPYIISFAQGISNLVKQFQTLPLWVQKVALYLGLFLIFVPIIVLYLGSFATLIGEVGGALIWLSGVAGTVIAAIFSPIGLAIAAAIALFIIFRDDFKNLFESLGQYFNGNNPLANGVRNVVDFCISMFNLLPQGVQNAMTATVRVIANAAKEVYSWFSYLNPWAHHSPSLVENVTTGMKAVINQFSTLGQIRKYTEGAYVTISKFGKQTAAMMKKAQDTTEAGDRKTVLKGAGSGAARTYDLLIKKLHVLQKTYDALGISIAKAERKATKEMAPINEAIYKNGEAQKKLQLQIALTEKQYGSFDDIKSKVEALNGQIEILRGTQTDLRNAGAGSDILGFYTDQINNLNSQQGGLSSQINLLDELKKKLEELQNQGDILDLQKDVKFDPILHNIDLMKDKYDLVGDAIDAIKTSLDNVTSAASSAAGKVASIKASKGGKGGIGVTDGNFPDVRGNGVPTRTGKNPLKDNFMGDQTSLINKWIDDQQNKMANMFSHINPFKTWKDKLANVFRGQKQVVPDNLGGIDYSGQLSAMDKIRNKIDPIVAKIRSIGRAFGKFVGPEVKDALHGIGNAFDGLGKRIGPEIKAWGKTLGPFMRALKSVAVVVGIVLAVITKLFLGVISGAIGPLLSAFINMQFGISKILRGILQTVAGVVNLVVDLFTDWKKLGPDLLNIWNGINTIIEGVLQILYSIVVDLIAAMVGAVIGLFKSMGRLAMIPIRAMWHAAVRVFRNLVADGGAVMGGLWGAVKASLSGLKNLGSWIWDHALHPALDRFKDLYTKVGSFFKNSAGIITKPFKSVINFVLKGVNKMTGGLNKIADVLPGIKWHIEPIQTLAQGGAIQNRRVGSGWVTNGARAIVGEGKANHPEYVVPTDPTHRARAITLFKALGSRLGVLDAHNKASMDGVPARNFQGIPQYGIGGVLSGALGGAKDLAKHAGQKALDFLAKHARHAASFLYKPFGAIADKLISKVGWSYGRKTAQGGADEVRNWIGGADKYYADVAKAGGGKWAKVLHKPYSIGGGIGSYKGHNGQDFPTSVGSSVYAMTGGKVTHSADLKGSGVGGYRSYGRYIEIQHSNGLKSLYAHNSKRIAQTGDQVRGGQLISKSGQTGNTTGPHLHLSVWKNGSLKAPLDVLSQHGIKMKNGGIVAPRVGGTMLNVGEAGQHEAVTPLPRGWKPGDSLGGGDNYNFYGDLSFPNVKSGEDAEEFLRNLESVVKD